LLRFAVRARGPMCDKYAELDKKIEHYRKLSASISDQLMLDGIKALIEEKQEF
jgi:hypothetical protein